MVLMLPQASVMHTDVGAAALAVVPASTLALLVGRLQQGGLIVDITRHDFQQLATILVRANAGIHEALISLAAVLVGDALALAWILSCGIEETGIGGIGGGVVDGQIAEFEMVGVYAA